MPGHDSGALGLTRVHPEGGPLDTSRPTFSQIWLQLAELVSRRSTCPRGHNGAVLIDRTDRCLATGYNGAPRRLPHCDEVGCLRGADGGCRRTVHAEANAVIQAGPDAMGAVLYCTTSPCLACAGLILNSGVALVVFANLYRDPSGVVLLVEGGVQCQHMDTGGRFYDTVAELLSRQEDEE